VHFSPDDKVAFVLLNGFKDNGFKAINVKGVCQPTRLSRRRWKAALLYTRFFSRDGSLLAIDGRKKAKT